MEHRVGVVQVSDSFEQVWPRLAATAGLGHVRLQSLDDPAGRDACALLLSAGGREAECVPLLAQRAAGVPPVAVAGSDTDYRMVKQLLRAGADEYFALPTDLGDLRRWMESRAAAHPRPAAPAGR